MQNQKNNKNGYTIIETMISIAVFLIVIMIGMSALLNANLVHKKSQDMRSILDNLSFIMEDMSRNLRTGYDYHCTSLSDLSNLSDPLSCSNGNKLIAFKSSSGDQWVYKISSSNITRSINGGTDITLNPSEIVINNFSSNFVVTGAEPPNTDFQQPFVIIRLVGKIIYKGVESPFSLQTSVSQRQIDNIVK